MLIDENFIICKIEKEVVNDRKTVLKIWKTNNLDILHREININYASLINEWRYIEPVDGKILFLLKGESENTFGGFVIINLENGEWLRKLEYPHPLTDWSSRNHQIIISDKIRQEINIGKIQIMWNNYGIFNQFQLISFVRPDHQSIQIYDFASFIEEETD